METKTVLTDEEIIALGQQACAIEAGENGYILPVAFARAIEKAVLESEKAQEMRRDTLREALETMVEMVEMNGFGKAYAMDVARAALAAAPKFGEEAMNQLFCDLKTDEEKSNFFLMGRGYETGIIAKAIQNDVAMAYHRCAEYAKEVQALRKDADRYKWLKDQFRIMSPDMGGNHTWVLKRPIRRGQTIDEACDAAMEQDDDQ